MGRLDYHRYYLLSILASSLLFVLVAITISRTRTSLFGQASAPGLSSMSLENSYLFASPLISQANGTSIVRVTVFLLNTQGLGMSTKTVKLRISGPLTVSQVQPVTDTFGRAFFDLTSTNPGDYTISASVEDVFLSQTVSVVFR
ncbi:Ig-like domain-containing protein [Candidatus Gottesmanbacteria bacterium]|nr:Ig-like domain-containing protein [Candidatus Gottesmanbacteria bacterium]